MKRLVASAVILMGLGTGCSSQPPRPSVHAYPARGQSAEMMSRDVADCQAWAQQQTGYDPVADTAKGAAIGTLLGGALGAGTGAAVGAATGNSVGKSAATGAVIGGVAGGVTGGVYKYSKSKEGYDQAYAACMNGRGYTSGANSAAAPQPAPAAAPPPPPPPPAVVQAPPPPPVVVQAPPPPAVVVVQPPPPVVVVEPRRIHVPPGHFPPKGYCRLWYPGRPPGHQPPPIACHQIVLRPGAFVLYDGVAWDADYNWRAHSHRHPGSVPPAILRISVVR